MKELDDLQLDISGWRGKNFGPGSKSFECLSEKMTDPNIMMMTTQLVGMVEELGELSHAILKMVQGIRGMEDPLTFKTAAMDAIGDIMIYCMGLCDTLNLNMSDCIEKTAEQVLKRDWEKNSKDGKIPKKEAEANISGRDKEIFTEKSMKKAQRKFTKGETGYSFEQEAVIACVSSAIHIMLGDRKNEYNQGEINISDYWDNLTESFQMVKVKFLRMKALTAKLDAKPSMPTVHTLIDSAVDLMNYSGFHVANIFRQVNFPVDELKEICSVHGSIETFAKILDAVTIREIDK